MDVSEDLEGFLPEFEVVSVVEELESDVDLFVVGFGIFKVDNEGDFVVIGIGVDRLDDVSEVISHGLGKSFEFDLSSVAFAKVEGLLADSGVELFEFFVLLDDFEDDLVGIPEIFPGLSDVGFFSSDVSAEGADEKFIDVFIVEVFHLEELKK